VSQNKEFYEREIAPILKEVALTCAEHGMSFTSSVEYDKNEAGIANCLLPDAGLGACMVALVAATAPNLDKYVNELVQYCVEEGIDYSDSYIAAFAVEYLKKRAELKETKP
jgi:hypothetical protein